MAKSLSAEAMLAKMRHREPNAIRVGEPSLPFDPIERSKAVEAIVMKGQSRRYYRFRYANFYDGIVTGDMVGCNLLCDWGARGKCWNYARNANPDGIGKLHTPSEAAAKLTKIAASHGCDLIRLSGAEPFLGKASAGHLISIIKSMNNYKFVIETNAILVGYDPEIANMLRDISNVQEIRVSLKGWDKQQFEKTTSSKSIALDYQIAGIHALDSEGFNVQIAVSDAIFGCDESLYFLGDHFGVDRQFEVEETRKYPGQ